MWKRVAILALVGTVGFGCCPAARNVVPDPSTITVEEALKSVGQGLANMKQAEGGLKTGLLPSQVVVTFNVTAGGRDNSELVIDLNANAAPPTIPVTAGGKVETKLSSEATSSRSNQIVVKFDNVYFTPEKELITVRTPKDIKQIIDYIDGKTPLMAQ